MKNLIFSAYLLASVSLSHAAVLLSWDLPTTTTNATSIAATDVATGLSSTSLTRTGLGVGFDGSNLVNYGWRLQLPDSSGFASGSYISFTLAPQSGYEFSVDSIFFRRGNNTVAGTYELRTSLDSFATSVGSAAMPAFATGTSTINVTGVEDITSAVEFRLYSYTMNAPTGQRNIAFGSSTAVTDDFVVNGSVIPEPSAAALIAASLTGFMLRRRRVA